MIRWILKIIYNNKRSLRRSISWFESNLEFLLGESQESNLSYSIFLSLYVNISPMSLFLAGNEQLQIWSEAILLEDGLIKMTNNLSVYANKDVKEFKIKNIKRK